jgi:hypothetical protein
VVIWPTIYRKRGTKPMSVTQYVNVFDPTGRLSVGEVVEGRDAIVVAKQRKSIVLLPTDPLVYFSASPGFVYRPWGKGWLYDNVTPERGCPMMLGVSTDHPWVYWAIQIMPIRASEPMTGNLRLIANGASGGMAIGLSQDVRLLPLDELPKGPTGGVVAVGRCALGVVSPGILGMSIHGVGRNVRVVWSAVSAAGDKIDVQDAVPV